MLNFWQVFGIEKHNYTNTEMSVLEWLTSKILPEAVKTGSLGSNGMKFVSFEVSDEKGIDHVLSDVIFGDIVLESAESRRFINVPVVVKTRRYTSKRLLNSIHVST